MNNLGDYLKITELSKKCGGPKGLLAITAIGGAVIYKGSEITVRKCVKHARKYTEYRRTQKKEIVESLDAVTANVIKNISKIQ